MAAFDPHHHPANAAVSLLTALIQNACVNTGDAASGHEVRSVRTIQEYLGETGTVIEPAPGRASVVFRIEGSVAGAPRLLLLPHLDVVPASASDWTHDPFLGSNIDGVIWGRGAVDMLNVTAAMVVVFGWLKDGTLPHPAGDVILAAVADEEAGGLLGAHHIVENHWDHVACDYVLTEVAGPLLGASDARVLPVTVAEKGAVWRTAATQGTPGHGSQPHGRVNAVSTLAGAFARIDAADLPVSVSDEWQSIVPHLGLSAETAALLVHRDTVDDGVAAVAEHDASLARWIHACTHMTLSPTLMTGGTKINMIPDAASGGIDVRLLPGQDLADLDDHLRKTLGPELLDAIDLRPVLDMQANTSAPAGLMWDAIADAAELHLGKRHIVPTLTPVSTDARFFRARGIPAYGVGLFDDVASFPEMLAMFHGIDERVSVESVERTTRFLASTIEAFSARIHAGC